MAIHQLYWEQKINTSMVQVWDFVSSPANLKEITPDYMGFKITSKKMSEKMYPGMIISYKVCPVLNVPMNWVTEITQIAKHEYFVDEQRSGPYKMWHHEHHFKQLDDGILMTDILTYELPLGPLGDFINTLFVKKQIQNIFDYRKLKMIEIFKED